MSRLLCCLCARAADMGAALSHPQEGEACEGAALAVAPPTMADVIRERKKKAGGAGLGTLRRRIAAAARRPRDARPDRGCEHGRFIRSVVSSWRLAEVFVVCEQLEASAALRDLATQAALAREPANALTTDLANALAHRWWCDVELVGGNGAWSLCAHRAILAARCTYFRDLLLRYPSTWRVPLEGAGSSLSRAEAESCLLALYAANNRTVCDTCSKWERGSEGDLDIINVENTGTWRNTISRGGAGGAAVGGAGGGRCGCGARSVRRLGALLGFNVDSLHADLRYLLDSGEYSDCGLVFSCEGGTQFGFRPHAEVAAHRLLLAARSRYFRSVMSRRSSGAGGGGAPAAVCVDERVLPRRFARALLHAAYTDQVDLSLIGRNSTSPSSTNSTGTNSSTGWSAMGRGTRPTSTAMLDDAFQLYEIARFLEMTIVVQGCEDCIVEALSADTLPHVLRWAASPHASQWVHRQAQRYLLDEFCVIMWSGSAARLPRSALTAALSSSFLQASEAQALRAVLRWGALRTQQRDPPPARQLPRSGRKEQQDLALRAQLAPLLALVRLEHLPPDHDLLQQVVRRGLVEAPVGGGGGGADAWLGRGQCRPPRCFLPHLDELRALLRDQAVPEAELARVRRARLTHRIPDTLYMVAAAAEQSDDVAPAAGGGASGGAEGGDEALCCVSPRVVAALTARRAELTAATPAQRALALHRKGDRRRVYRQIALRAVRELSLPDSCADLLLADADTELGANTATADNNTAGHQPESSRSSTCRRELPTRPESGQHRSWVVEYRSPSRECWPPPQPSPAGPPGAGPPAPAAGADGRLSACVPDVAMAPNANTHLLTVRDYCRPPLRTQQHAEYVSGGVLQLDLGDGATHTPRPGSRALRAAHSAERARHREHNQGGCSSRPRTDEEELRAALELSVIRAYSAVSSRTLPSYRAELPAHAHVRSRPGAPLDVAANTLTRHRHNDPAMCGSSSVSRTPSASPRRTRRDLLYGHEYGVRVESSLSGSGGASRGHSPNNYA